MLGCWCLDLQPVNITFNLVIDRSYYLLVSDFILNLLQNLCFIFVPGMVSLPVDKLEVSMA